MGGGFAAFLEGGVLGEDVLAAGFLPFTGLPLELDIDAEDDGEGPEDDFSAQGFGHHGRFLVFLTGGGGVSRMIQLDWLSM